MMPLFRTVRLVVLAFTGFALQAVLHAQTPAVERMPEPGPRDCRVLMDAKTGRIILRQGPCGLRHSPCSTFKLPLAVMGFDAGILKDAHTPSWKYDAGRHESTRPEEQTGIDPVSWEKLSVVWYSQQLTTELGSPAFQDYVDGFDYGNRNLKGDPGKGNGLTHAWLMSSLEISADEQAAFVGRLLDGTLPVKNPQSLRRAMEIIPVFSAGDGWTVTGKTGSGFQRRADGELDRNRGLGWFVGWAVKDGRTVIFANVILDETPQAGYGGPRCREAFIKALPGLMLKAGS